MYSKGTTHKGSAWVVLLLTIFLIEPVAAQNADVRFGRVSYDDFQLHERVDDEDASAIILFDQGEVYFGRNLNLLFHRHRRIYIVNAAGAERWGNVEIPFYASNRSQQVRNIRGRTYNLQGGNINRDNLRSRDVFEEKITDDWSMMKFAFPNVQPGSIIEYSYTVESQGGSFLRDWVFQTSEPTLYSEYIAYIPDEFRYMSISQGSDRYTVRESTPYDIHSRPGIFATVNGGLRNRWVATDVPAIRTEPFMTTASDYNMQIRFQLSEVVFPGRNPQRFMQTWDQLAKDLMDNRYLGRQISANREIRAAVEEIVDGLTSNLDRAKAIYAYVANNISWNRSRGIFTDEGVNNAFSRKTGNGADIAYLTIAMMREAGLEAWPVLLSTRNNGRLVWQYPLATQFNHVVVYVDTREGEFLLDPSVDDLPFGLLGYQSLNEHGWLLDRDNPQQINLVPTDHYHSRSMANFEMLPDGTLLGQIQIRYHGYEALEVRNRLRSTAEQTDFILNNVLKGMPESSITYHSFSNLDDPEQPLVLTVSLENNQYISQAGDVYYFNPIALNRMTSNLFSAEQRTFPVDIGHSLETTYIMSFAVPTGYEIEELPDPVRVLFRDMGVFQQVYQVQDDLLQVMSAWQINNPYIVPELYQDLRAFFGDIVDAHNVQIVIRPVADETSDSE